MRSFLHPCAIPLALTLFLPACGAKASADVAPWVQSFVCANGQASTSMAVDPSGHIALGGFYIGQLTLEQVALPMPFSDDDDVFAAGLSPDGTVQWAAEAGGFGQQNANAVALDSTGAVLLAGQFANTLDFGVGPLTATSNDSFVAKLSPAGSAVWAKSFSADDGGPTGAGDSNPAAVAADASGNVAIGGIFSGTIGFGGGALFTALDVGESGFVAELDANGSHVYSLDFGGGATSVTSLAYDPQGDLYVGGINSGTLIAGGTVLTSSTTSGYVVKLDPHGVPLWAVQLDGDGSTVASVAVGGSGNLVVAGSFQGHLQAGSLVADASMPGASDGLALQLSAAGEVQWIKALPSGPPTAIAAPAGGGAVVLGTYLGSPDFGGGALPSSDAPLLFATRLAADGTHVHTQPLQVAMPEPNDGMPTAVGTGIAAVDADVVISGTYGGLLEINGTSVASTGPGDLFVARLQL